MQGLRRVAILSALALFVGATPAYASNVTALAVEVQTMDGKTIPCGGSTTHKRVRFLGKATASRDTFLNIGIDYIDHQLSNGGADWYQDVPRVHISAGTTVNFLGEQDILTIGQHEFRYRQLGGGLQGTCLVNRIDGSPTSVTPTETTLPPIKSSAGSMNWVDFELQAYATGEPIPCGGSTSAGRVKGFGDVSVNGSLFWHLGFSYIDHQSATPGLTTWETEVYNVLSQDGVSTVIKPVAQQIITMGQHTFMMEHLGAKVHHMDECTITRQGERGRA